MQGSVGDDFLVSVNGHGCAENEAHEERAKGLQAVEPLGHKRVLRRGHREGLWDEWRSMGRVPQKARAAGWAAEAEIDAGSGGAFGGKKRGGGALFVNSVGGCGEFDGELGGGCLLEAGVEGGAAGYEEFGGAERGEWLG